MIAADKSRKLVKDLTILDADGDTVIPDANDVVRVKIGRLAGNSLVPILDLDQTATDNGSKVTKNSPTSGKNRLEISVADMATLQPGLYTLELSLVDGTDSNAIKHADNIIFHVGRTMAGDIGAS